ncbi:di-/tricarboxylate transporter [Desulfosporosinus orientis DSM 765]|uniref:Di-/tricarboxylate transporter n=1 Tax=Desulfosporosinus orientis (strain ATCC 19365 / DSM 765 / NCIMB 8382 / VKM B-1628 / Singapore I) TaxID=768706 RepID=G7WBX9_DESOD|nr:SLC13 family permease [Desulfosporosinus orientis]AET69376.1 di-/tricarboxylate transporter [Desulfosporosinus orientis DSM 765]
MLGTKVVCEKKNLKSNRSMYIHSAIGIGFMLGFPLLNPIEPITPVGMHIFAIFIGMVYLWSTVNGIWPSILGLLLIGVSGFAPLKSVALEAFGSDISVVIMLALVFFAGVEYAGCTEYLARWFLTRKIINGKPYVFLFVFFLASYFLSGLTEPIASLLILWPITVEFMNELGIDRKEKVFPITVFGVYFAATLAQPMFPFKGAALAIVGTFQKASGLTVNTLSFVLFNIILSLTMIIIFMLLLKFVYKPDMSKLKNISVEQFQKSPLPPMNLQQKILLLSLFAFIILLLAPSFLPKTWVIVALLKNIGTLGVTMFCVVVLMVLHVDGKPVLPFKAVAAKSFSWDVYFLVVAALYGANAVSNDVTGIKAWLIQVLQPLLGDKPILVFVGLLLIFSIITTNFANNAGMAIILIPVIMAFAKQYPSIGLVGLYMCITMIVFFALITPAASPYCGMMHARRDLIDVKDILKMGVPLLIIGLILYVLVGFPLAQILFS